MQAVACAFPWTDYPKYMYVVLLCRLETASLKDHPLLYGTTIRKQVQTFFFFLPLLEYHAVVILHSALRSTHRRRLPQPQQPCSLTTCYHFTLFTYYSACVTAVDALPQEHFFPNYHHFYSCHDSLAQLTENKGITDQVRRSGGGRGSRCGSMSRGMRRGMGGTRCRMRRGMCRGMSCGMCCGMRRGMRRGMGRGMSCGMCCGMCRRMCRRMRRGRRR